MDLTYMFLHVKMVVSQNMGTPTVDSQILEALL